MSSSELAYRTKTASREAISEHLSRCDACFNPPLHTYVDIGEYARKIFDHAVTFECWRGKELVGLIGAYFNNVTRIAFVTSVSVLKEYQGEGIATALMGHLIDCATGGDMIELKLELYESNSKALQLYARHGFVVAQREENKTVMCLRTQPNVTQT